MGRRMGLRQGHCFRNRGSKTHPLIARPGQPLLGSHGFWTPTSLCSAAPAAQLAMLGHCLAAAFNLQAHTHPSRTDCSCSHSDPCHPAADTLIDLHSSCRSLHESQGSQNFHDQLCISTLGSILGSWALASSTLQCCVSPADLGIVCPFCQSPPLPPKLRSFLGLLLPQSSWDPTPLPGNLNDRGLFSTSGWVLGVMWLSALPR